MTKNTLTKKEVSERNRKLAEERNLARKKRDMKCSNILRNTQKLSAFDLGVYREACEEYAAAVRAFENGKRVKGKGKGKTVTVVPHPPMPSFKDIHKKKAVEAANRKLNKTVKPVKKTA